jgi:antitoxin component of MazEF toxin-antitoxin module
MFFVLKGQEKNKMIQTKQIKKYGNSLVITIDSEDAKIMKLKEGDIIQIEILKEVKQNGKS